MTKATLSIYWLWTNMEKCPRWPLHPTYGYGVKGQRKTELHTCSNDESNSVNVLALDKDAKVSTVTSSSDLQYGVKGQRNIEFQICSKTVIWYQCIQKHAGIPLHCLGHHRTTAVCIPVHEKRADLSPLYSDTILDQRHASVDLPYLRVMLRWWLGTRSLAVENSTVPFFCTVSFFFHSRELDCAFLLYGFLP